MKAFVEREIAPSWYTPRGEVDDDTGDGVLYMHPFDIATMQAGGDTHKELDLILEAIISRVEEECARASRRMTKNGSMLERLQKMYERELFSQLSKTFTPLRSFAEQKRLHDDFVTFPVHRAGVPGTSSHGGGFDFTSVSNEPWHFEYPREAPKRGWLYRLFHWRTR